MTATPARTADRPSERTVRIVFGVLAAYHLALGLLMVVAPKVFFDQIGPFGARNDHYIRDVATFYLAFGVGLALAVRRPSWRVPVVAVVALQYVFHVVNHLVDVSKADPGLARAGRRDRARARTAVLLLWVWRAEERR